MSITLFHGRSENSRIYRVQTSGFSEYQVFKVISLVFSRNIPVRTNTYQGQNVYWLSNEIKFSLIHLVVVDLIAVVVATVLLSSTAASFAEITKRFHLKNSVVP